MCYHATLFLILISLVTTRFKHIATGHYLAAYPKPKEKNASPISLRRRDKDESGAGGMLKLNVPQLKRRMGLRYRGTLELPSTRRQRVQC